MHKPLRGRRIWPGPPRGRGAAATKSSRPRQSRPRLGTASAAALAASAV